MGARLGTTSSVHSHLLQGLPASPPPPPMWKQPQEMWIDFPTKLGFLPAALEKAVSFSVSAVQMCNIGKKTSTLHIKGRGNHVVNPFYWINKSKTGCGTRLSMPVKNRDVRRTA